MRTFTSRSSRRHIDGPGVALAIHVVMCCAVTMSLAFGAYRLMQPTRIENFGLAAYKPPPATVIDFVGAAPAVPAGEPQSEPEVVPAAIEPSAETLDPALPPQQIEQQTARAKPQRVKRQRSAHRKHRRDPMTGYAFHPSFGRSRAWY